MNARKRSTVAAFAAFAVIGLATACGAASADEGSREPTPLTQTVTASAPSQMTVTAPSGVADQGAPAAADTRSGALAVGELRDLMIREKDAYLGGGDWHSLVDQVDVQLAKVTGMIKAGGAFTAGQLTPMQEMATAGNGLLKAQDEGWGAQMINTQWQMFDMAYAKFVKAS
jgi:hypothetical protein